MFDFKPKGAMHKTHDRLKGQSVLKKKLDVWQNLGNIIKILKNHL